MKVNLNIPELHEMTLSQYQQYMSMCVEEDGDMLFKGTNSDIVSIFLRLDKKVVDAIPKKKVDEIAVIVNNHLSVECDLVRTFKFRGVHWGFVPSLDKITWGENRDANAYISDFAQIHKAMAVLYRPITSQLKGKYLIEDYEGSAKYADILKEMPLHIVFGATVFFYNLLRDLLRHIPDYIRKQLTPGQLLTRVSLENGTNTTKSQHSVSHLIALMKTFTEREFTNA